MATWSAVSTLWRLCRATDTGAGACCDKALRVGTSEKLLQVGCGGVTKDRANELLKLLNGFRGSVECIEMVDFKGLKRPF
ncbi:hypothetical protein CFC21_096012 [Triticum aestivum]|uniref:U-box domain-containing protein n=2 Tax=Triticum aestivum TaxID=4565 RepID=A0A9R1LRD4_WHEAT|nr:hypothetical protein CFC21_096012 [Triticum aestivum]